LGAGIWLARATSPEDEEPAAVPGRPEVALAGDELLAAMTEAMATFDKRY
jgi:hypothetical protein